MIPTSDLEPGQLRLLEVDNRIIVPVNTHIRVITTGGDVIHSWAIPSLGIKMDSIPGRLNQTSMFIQREGVYYGQCSELCLRLGKDSNYGKKMFVFPITWFSIMLDVAWYKLSLKCVSKNFGLKNFDLISEYVKPHGLIR